MICCCNYRKGRKEGRVEGKKENLLNNAKIEGFRYHNILMQIHILCSPLTRENESYFSFSLQSEIVHTISFSY